MKAAQRIIYILLFILIALMPFHAFFTTWAGSSFGNRALWQAWKEIAIVVMSLVAGGLVAAEPKLRRTIFKSPINQLVALYALLHVALGLILKSEPIVFIFSLKTNLAFLIVFILAQIAVFDNAPKKLNQHLLLGILISGGLVGLFGLLQVTVLPDDVLRHFGYGADTIQPFLNINDKASGFTRILSTLGGPNQLGQYLILPISVAFYVFWRRSWRWLIVLLMPMLVALFFSYARGAWIGLTVALGLMLARWLKPRQFLVLGLVSVALLIAAAVLVSAYRSNSYVRRVILHTNDDRTNVRDSDSERIRAISKSINTVVAKPLGYGPGSAGPASLRNVKNTGIISENYYLQLAIEIGVVGLVIFALINILIARELWRLGSSNGLAIALLGTLAAVSFINLVLHGWTDSTIALVWWGSAGALIGNSRERKGKTGVNPLIN